MTKSSLTNNEPSVQRRGIFYGWWIVTAGFSLQVIIGSLMMHSFTAYFPLLQSQFGWSRSLLSGAFALSRAESGILGPLQGWLIDKFGSRMMVRIGMVMFGIGFILFSQTDSVLDYYVTFAIMAVGSSIAGFLPVATSIINWFDKRRGVAMGITLSGFGIGGLLVPLVAWLLMSIGWRPTALFSGILIIIVGLPLAQVMRQRPEDHGYLPDGITKQTLDHTDHGSQLYQDDPTGFTAREALKTPAFWLLSLGHGMALLTVGAVSLHLVPHIIDSAGLTITGASTAVAVMTTFNILGQVGGGFLGDIFSKRILAAIAMLVHSVALLILAYASSIAPVLIFAALHGIAWGVRGPMMTTIRADYFGRRSFATIMGFSSLVVMIGMTTGPLFAGFMADIFNGYRVGFLVISAFTGLGSVFFVMAKEPKLPQRLLPKASGDKVPSIPK